MGRNGGDSARHPHVKYYVVPIFLSNLDSFYFFLLIVVPRTSKTMLNKSDENRHFCLVFDLRRKAFSFLQLSRMLAEGLSYDIYCVEV